MKLNLSKKQFVLALLYSSLVPIFSYIDMQVTLYQFDLFGVSEYSRTILSFCVVVTLPFLILGSLFATWLSMTVFNSLDFSELISFLFILIQVVLVIHFINNRKIKQNDYLKNHKK